MLAHCKYWTKLWVVQKSMNARGEHIYSSTRKKSKSNEKGFYRNNNVSGLSTEYINIVYIELKTWPEGRNRKIHNLYQCNTYYKIHPHLIAIGFFLDIGTPTTSPFSHLSPFLLPPPIHKVLLIADIYYKLYVCYILATGIFHIATNINSERSQS